MATQETCPACDGRGVSVSRGPIKRYGATCHKCGGKGTVNVVEPPAKKVVVLACSNPLHDVFRYCPSPDECANDFEMREAE